MIVNNLQMLLRLEGKLEIWGKAQREAARHRKSDWGTVKGLKFRLQQSHMA